MSGTASRADLRALGAAARLKTRRRTGLTLAALVAVLGYLIYVWFAFDISGILSKSNPDMANTILRDSVAHKIHVTRDLRAGALSITVENERTATFETPPPWVSLQQDGAPLAADAAIGDGKTLTAIVDLGDGYRAELGAAEVTLDTPQDGRIRIWKDGRSLRVEAPQGVPDWLRVKSKKVDGAPDWDKRVQFSLSKIELHRFYYGWENFFFPFDSPLHPLSASEVVSLAFDGERLDPSQSNAALIFQTFWTNPDWQHNHIFKALLETLLMGVLGTFAAAFAALPLAFLAARNFTLKAMALSPGELALVAVGGPLIGWLLFGPTILGALLGLLVGLALYLLVKLTPFSERLAAGGKLTIFLPIRFLVRRLFDILRGVDMLIWSLIFIRAFGLGPLTGALAIAFTDTGTLGKLFSEALENADDKQIEGVRATGASQTQRYRFGVIPQLAPVFASQTLYFLESNMRSATVIGALGAGGIGLVLVETMKTQRDWENVLYIITLTVLLVVAMDMLSSKLRRRLIEGSGREARAPETATAVGAAA